MDLTLEFFLKSETYSFIPEPVLFCLCVVIHYYNIDFKVLVQLKLNDQLFVFPTLERVMVSFSVSSLNAEHLML